MEKGSVMSTQGYVALKVLPESANKIVEFVQGLGIRGVIDPNKLHMTVMYDKSNPETEYEPSTNTYSASIKSIGRLGDGDYAAIVMHMECPEIVKRHEELKNAGFTHSFPDFTPHISLKYGFTDSDYNIISKSIEDLKSIGNIRLGEEYSELISGEKTAMMNKLATDISNKAIEKLAIIKLHGGGLQPGGKLDALYRSLKKGFNDVAFSTGIKDPLASVNSMKDHISTMGPVMGARYVDLANNMEGIPITTVLERDLGAVNYIKNLLKNVTDR